MHRFILHLSYLQSFLGNIILIDTATIAATSDIHNRTQIPPIFAFLWSQANKDLR